MPCETQHTSTSYIHNQRKLKRHHYRLEQLNKRYIKYKTYLPTT